MRLIVAVSILLFSAGAAQPPTPPATPLPDCSASDTPHGRVIIDRIAYIFFDTDSAQITLQAATILDHFASGYDAPPHCLVTVAGHADRAGPAGHNLRLSGRRARAVAAFLRRKGLSAPMAVERNGEARPLVETADGVAERQNRFVVVYVINPPS